VAALQDQVTDGGALVTVFLVLAGFGFGCWVGERSARKNARGWRHYQPRYDFMKDCK
jgi:hypothetical protein